MTNYRSSSRDQNLIQEEAMYYGVVREIIELDYYNFKQTVFYCDWVRIEDKVNGCKIDPETNLTFVNLVRLKSNSNQQDKPFCLASRASQVFYCKNPSKDDWYVFIDAPQRLTKDIDTYEDPLVVEARTTAYTVMSTLLNDLVDEDEEIAEGTWVSEDPETARTYYFLAGHTCFDESFLMPFLEAKVAKIKSNVEKNPESRHYDVNDNPVGQAYGPEKKGHVRGEGIRVSKSMLKHMKHAKTFIEGIANI
ncbi:hypothetical protein GIB67_012009 [Kingdonia uniflora]|uniref:DUF4216 domain-containing protein n=1 Tax=Kingdonia uniflora TaxID=39325 RepID=A0A7J7M0A2_9MAGN|nr:hypothetical protein GIB67_012009 [Kingdonia uniflora]